MLQLLIVDDDKHIRRYLTAVLSDAGYRVYCAESSAEALRMMEIVKVDLIVLDIMMPGMDGYQFTKLLRDCHHYLPILMLNRQAAAGRLEKGLPCRDG